MPQNAIHSASIMPDVNRYQLRRHIRLMQWVTNVYPLIVTLVRVLLEAAGFTVTTVIM